MRAARAILAIALFAAGPNPAGAVIIYSGILDLEGPAFDVDLDGDGSSDFTTQWRFRAGGSGSAAFSFDVDPAVHMRHLTNEAMRGPFVVGGAKAPLGFATPIGPTPPSGPRPRRVSGRASST